MLLRVASRFFNSKLPFLPFALCWGVANNIRYLKASKDPVYEVWQINAYPTTTNAVQVATTLIYAWTSDTILKGRRWPPIIFGAVCPHFRF